MAALSKDDVRLLRAATALALAGVDAAVAVLAADGTEEGAQDAAVRSLSTKGAASAPTAPVVRLVDGTALAVLDLSVLVDGVEGGVGRTVVLPGGGADDQAVVTAVRDVQQALSRACRAGATQADLGPTVPTSMSWAVRGVDGGADAPVITPKEGADVTLEEGTAWFVEVATSRSHWRDLVVVKP